MTAWPAELSVGERIRVTGFEKGRRAYRQKLLSMGLTPGTTFTVTRVAPMGDPIEIRVRDFDLSLRRHEASVLKVERSPALWDD
jgi:ferrous iron transport protein A